MMTTPDLFANQGDTLEDFWGRRECGPRFQRDFHLFGWPVAVTSNRSETLEAIDVSLPLFSRARAYEEKPLQLHVAVREMPFDPGPVPEDLFTRIQYSGHGNWLAMHLDAWGLVHMALDEGRALVVVAPRLARDAAALSRFVLNTVLLNLLENRGFSLVHATSVVRGERVVLLVGDHNSGKSTTALRLALRGYDFLADSMIFMAPLTDEIELSGFPVGLAKVRGDMLHAFAELAPLFAREITREEVKFGLNLRRSDQVTVREEAVRSPSQIDLFFVQRQEGTETAVTSVSPEEAYHELFRNSAYWHKAEFWRRHLAQLRRLIDAARCRRLILGRDVEGLLAAVDD